MHARMAPKPPPPQPQTEANGEPPAAPPTAHEVHKEALLDFFGAKVKAQEMLTRTHELTQLSQIIQSYEAPTRFRCDSRSPVPNPPRRACLACWLHVLYVSAFFRMSRSPCMCMKRILKYGWNLPARSNPRSAATYFLLQK